MSISTPARPVQSPGPAQRVMPGAGTIGSGLALVVAVLMALAGVNFLAQHPVYEAGELAIEQTGGTLEFVLDGVGSLLSAGLLVWGVLLLRRGVPKGRQAIIVGSTIGIIVVLLWLGRIQEGTALVLAAPVVLLGIAAIVLMNTAGMVAWFAEGLPTAHTSVSQRTSMRWNALPRPQQWAFCTIIVLLLVLLPLLNSTTPIIGSLSTEPGTDFGIALFNAARYALIAIGLNVVVGQAGLLDLGYVGFFAIGAYVVALLTSPDSSVQSLTSPTWAWLICVPIAMGVTMIFGLILGGPTLRLRGDYLAIVTLGFGEIVRLVADNVPPLRGQSGFQDIAGPPGSTGKDPVFQQTTGGTAFFYLTVAFIIVILILVGNLERSRVGRAWVAIRDDEDAAEIMGVPTFKFKLWAFVVGAAIGGLSGALYVAQIGFVNNQRFDPVTSILFLAAVVLGGAGNKVGVIIGGALVSYIPDRFTAIADKRLLIFGIALIVLMIFRPQGLLGARQRLLTFGRNAYQRITGGPPPPADSGGALSSDAKGSGAAKIGDAS